MKLYNIPNFIVKYYEIEPYKEDLYQSSEYDLILQDPYAILIMSISKRTNKFVIPDRGTLITSAKEVYWTNDLLTAIRKKDEFEKRISDANLNKLYHFVILQDRQP